MVQVLEDPACCEWRREVALCRSSRLLDWTSFMPGFLGQEFFGQATF